MKQGSDSEKKPDSKSVGDLVKEEEGIDALKALQVISGIICAVLVIWILFHCILHLF